MKIRTFLFFALLLSLVGCEKHSYRVVCRQASTTVIDCNVTLNEYFLPLSGDGPVLKVACDDGHTYLITGAFCEAQLLAEKEDANDRR